MSDIKSIEVTHAILNTRLEALEAKVDTLTVQINELIAIKHKGLGVFWLASIILTSVFAAAISSLSGWLRGG